MRRVKYRRNNNQNIKDEAVDGFFHLLTHHNFDRKILGRKSFRFDDQFEKVGVRLVGDSYLVVDVQTIFDQQFFHIIFCSCGGVFDVARILHG
uniref:Uncharacterized protein n=1 Tax=Romanomermis culicivorax TaxID=13658 RepID=A0A915HX52_ROMCU